MDLDFQHPTEIYSIAPCRNNDAQDLIAIGGDHSVDVLRVVGLIYIREVQFTNFTYMTDKHRVRPRRVFPHRYTYNYDCMVIAVHISSNK